MMPLQVRTKTSKIKHWKLISVLELDTLSEESYKDSTLIMQLLRDNLVRIIAMIINPIVFLTISDSLDFLRGRTQRRVRCALS